MKNRTRLLVDSVMYSSSCMTATLVRKSRLRGSGSVFKWFWLAIIIIGRSQVVRTRRGADTWSSIKC